MLRMPFSADEFFAVFAAYNDSIWPGQLLLAGGAAAILVLSIAPTRRSNGWIAAFLALLWAWTGVVYHLLHFAVVNPAALLFGALFIVQAGLLALYGANPGSLAFRARRDVYGIMGVILAFYALVGYPLVGIVLGHRYPAMPTFGAPCPVVIFTFAVLLLAQGRVPASLLVVPTVWALLGSTAVFAFAVYQDAVLSVAAVAGGALILHRNRRYAAAHVAGTPVVEEVRRPFVS